GCTPKGCISKPRVAQRTLGTREATAIYPEGVVSPACFDSDAKCVFAVVGASFPRVRCATLGFGIEPLRGKILIASLAIFHFPFLICHCSISFPPFAIFHFSFSIFHLSSVPGRRISPRHRRQSSASTYFVDRPNAVDQIRFLLLQIKLSIGRRGIVRCEE